MEPKAVVLARSDTHPSACDRSATSATLRVANHSIIWHVLESLRPAGVGEAIVVGTNAALSQIELVLSQEETLDCRLTYVPCEADDNPIAMLTPAAKLVGDASCLIHTADGLLGQPLESLVRLLRPDHPDLVLLLHNDARRQEPWDQEALQLLRISEMTGFESLNALTGVFLLGRGALRVACSSETRPAPTAMLTTIADRLAASGGRIHAGRACWRGYAGDPQDLLDMNRMVLDRLPTQTTLYERNGNRIEGRVVIHPSAQIRDSVIEGPAIVGAHSRIEDAYIGPYTAVGSDVIIEGSEISRSIVLDRVEIRHVRDRIESSTIGIGASVRSEFALPKATRLHIGAGAQLVLT